MDAWPVDFEEQIKLNDILLRENAELRELNEKLHEKANHYKFRSLLYRVSLMGYLAQRGINPGAVDGLAQQYTNYNYKQLENEASDMIASYREKDRRLDELLGEQDR